MKISAIFLFCSLANIIAAPTYSQTARISLNLKDVTIDEVLNKIENESEFYFLFNQKLIDVTKVVTVQADKEPIGDILKDIFSDNVKAVVYDRQIILSPNELSVAFESPQQFSVKGTIKDGNSNEPLAGVTVLIEGTNQGIITDNNGFYSIPVQGSNAVLLFSFIGYKSQRIEVGTNRTIDVVLVPNTTSLDEVVVVGYGTQKRGTITGAIADVKGDIISKTSMASTSNSLAGQLPGLISLQTSGQPGADAALLSIRGFGTALTIVDGVEADFNTIDANQIESVSILKDGASSIYGSRAGNGVILITTKRGNLGKPIFTLNSSFSQQSVTAWPAPSSAGQYTEMASEAWLNSGQDPNLVPYTKDQIQKYYDGTDPQYPNTNWFDALISKWHPQQQHNLSLRGGSDNIKYYGFFGYLDQQSMLKHDGGSYGRYNFQSNIDAKILDNLSLQLDIASTFEDNQSTTRPQVPGDNTIWQDLWQNLPIYPSEFPDKTKVPYAKGLGNVLTNRSISGYSDTKSQNLRGTAVLNYSFKPIKGLSAKAFINYNQDISYNKNFKKPVTMYFYDAASDKYSVAAQLDSKANLTQMDRKGRVITGQLSLTYDRTFANDHHITAMGLYEAIDYNTGYLFAGRLNYLTPAIDQIFAGNPVGMFNDGSATEMGRASYVGRVNYSYKDKYLLETSLRRDASAKFPSDSRWGLFPSVSLGWRISEESFMKNLGAFDNLKFRGSYGKSGLDNVSNFAYLSAYQVGLPYAFGSGAAKGYVSTGLANPILSWESTAITNLGLDFSLWQKRLYGEVEFFHRKLTGIPGTKATSLPSTFGANLPVENINSLNDKGFELRMGTSGSSNGFKYDISGNISYSRSKWDHFEESAFTDPDQIRIEQKSGQYTDRTFGYQSAGLFTSQDQITALKFNQDGLGNTSLKPGDVQYVDVNGDKVLDWKDKVEIGNGTIPHWIFGFNTSLNYKNFDLGVLFQGAFGYSTLINFQHQQLLPAIVYNERWTATNNNANALFPRLGGALTNSYISDYNYKKTGYLRLKTFSIGYTLPKNWIKKVQLENVRLYMSGSNLFTFSNLVKYGLDPEAPSAMAGYYYPQQKTITFGVNISF